MLEPMLGRPLVARFARDFCSLDPEVERRPVMPACSNGSRTCGWASAAVAIVVAVVIARQQLVELSTVEPHAGHSGQ
jgi:hypothetical protein